MIHALHGNFGLPSDWEASLPPGVPAKAWHLWEIRRHHPEARTLTGFATWFNNQIEALPPDPKRVLAGYSLGGRLALHVLADRPALWHRALIISAHPGLTSEAERAARLRHDHIWLERCQGGADGTDEVSPDSGAGGQDVRPPHFFETWSSVCADWHSQAVLASQGAAPDGLPLEPWRRDMATAFDGWSLGRQAFLLPALRPFQGKGLWLAGGLDARFCALARSAVHALDGFQLDIIPNAGHRLLKDQPGAVQSRLMRLAGWDDIQ